MTRVRMRRLHVSDYLAWSRKVSYYKAHVRAVPAFELAILRAIFHPKGLKA
jgi:hypothetical protein